MEDKENAVADDDIIMISSPSSPHVQKYVLDKELGNSFQTVINKNDSVVLNDSVIVISPLSSPIDKAKKHFQKVLNVVEIGSSSVTNRIDDFIFKSNKPLMNKLFRNLDNINPVL